MNNNRRDFLKLSSLTGLGMASGGILKVFANGENNHNIYQPSLKQNSKRFNMSGYAAPRLETVRVGFIGLGQGGPLI